MMAKVYLCAIVPLSWVYSMVHLTPSDGGLFNTPESAAAHVKQMIEDGADIIDLGVESTRPGSTPLTADEEIERLSLLIDPVLNASTVPVSIDTYHAKTAEYAFSKGAHILNDVWGLHYDPDMAAVAANFKVPVIIMHNSNDTNYGDIIEDMKAFFFCAIDKALKEGLHLNKSGSTQVLASSVKQKNKILKLCSD